MKVTTGGAGAELAYGGHALAYRDTIGDNAYLLRRTVQGTFDFRGRSRRTEVIYFWIATALAGVILGFPLVIALPVEQSVAANDALRLLLVVPMFALFVRRLHDQDRSGWWGMLLPLSIALSVPAILTSLSNDTTMAFRPQRFSAFSMIEIVVQIAILILCFLPGTPGDNRFGPDPRLTE